MPPLTFVVNCKSKVNQFRFSVFVQEYVRRLEITVYYVL